VRHLSEAEYLWSVTFTSRDDGHRCTAAWFTDRDEAEAFCRRERYGDDQRVVQTSLWRSDDGEYFEVSVRAVPVDEHVHRRNAMQKLSPSEMRALGLSR
jgi:hypothetical protein